MTQEHIAADLVVDGIPLRVITGHPLFGVHVTTPEDQHPDSKALGAAIERLQGLVRVKNDSDRPIYSDSGALGGGHKIEWRPVYRTSYQKAASAHSGFVADLEKAVAGENGIEFNAHPSVMVEQATSVNKDSRGASR